MIIASITIPTRWYATRLAMMLRITKINAASLAQGLPVHNPQAITKETKPMIISTVPRIRGIMTMELDGMPKYENDRIVAATNKSPNPVARW
jgi:hypothetical protein